jgi:hypothetical protein
LWILLKEAAMPAKKKGAGKKQAAKSAKAQKPTR